MSRRSIERMDTGEAMQCCNDRSYWKRLAAAALLLLLAACASKPPAQKYPVEVAITATDSINVTEVNTARTKAGTSRPVNLTLYELALPAKFSASSYFELKDNAKAALGEELIAVHDLGTIGPKAQQADVRPLQADTRFLGVVAGFINRREHCCVSVPADPSKLKRVLIDVDGSTVKITTEDKPKKPWWKLF